MLLAFHNDPAIQSHYIQRVQQHQQLDEIRQGFYWQNGKGCAVGCTIHSDNHLAYEIELGIPRQLAYLQDRIFEGLSNADAKEFPLAFLQAIPLGADLSLIVARFLVWLLADTEHGVIRFASERGKAAIQTVVELYQRKIAGEEISEDAWYQARHAASADASADAAAASASAAAAAYAVAYAVAAAASAAASAAAYAAAARKEYYKVMATKLIELLAASNDVVACA